MKTYLDFMNEISAPEIYEGLLGYGMFSEKMPPVFSSKQFYDYCQANKPSFKDKWYSFVCYDNMRNTNVIRELGIPTPMAYQRLCDCIQTNWVKIINHFSEVTKGQKHIISRIHIRKMKGTPALFQMNYDNWREDGSPEVDLLIGSRFIIHADISKCFPSIYSHSLPWAIAGKKFSKSRKGKKESFWQDDLDKRVRNCKYGETHGMLIGPHASNLLAEVRLTVIDKELYDKGWKYTRHIDDYTCYVESAERAQLFLIDLNTELRKFDLSINDSKTKISELPVALTETWVRQVCNTKTFLRNGLFDYISVRSYFDSAIEIMHKNNDDSAILNYAIKSLPIDNMTTQAKSLAIKTILYLCLLYPYLAHVIDEYVFERFNVDKKEIEEFSNSLFNQELAVKNYDAVCYALFFSMKYGFSIAELSAQDAVNSDSCIYKLLAFIQFEKENNIAEKEILRTHAIELKDNEEDFGRNWLFIYEVLNCNDLTGDWKKIKQNGITFVKTAYD